MKILQLKLCDNINKWLYCEDVSKKEDLFESVDIYADFKNQKLEYLKKIEEDNNIRIKQFNINGIETLFYYATNDIDNLEYHLYFVKKIYEDEICIYIYNKNFTDINFINDKFDIDSFDLKYTLFFEQENNNINQQKHNYDKINKIRFYKSEYKIHVKSVYFINNDLYHVLYYKDDIRNQICNKGFMYPIKSSHYKNNKIDYVILYEEYDNNYNVSSSKKIYFDNNEQILKIEFYKGNDIIKIDNYIDGNISNTINYDL